MNPNPEPLPYGLTQRPRAINFRVAYQRHRHDKSFHYPATYPTREAAIEAAISYRDLYLSQLPLHVTERLQRKASYTPLPPNVSKQTLHGLTYYRAHWPVPTPQGLQWMQKSFPVNRYGPGAMSHAARYAELMRAGKAEEAEEYLQSIKPA